MGFTIYIRLTGGMKNILLSYFHTTLEKRQEVVPLLGAFVGFTREDYIKAIDSLSGNNIRAGWLSGWLGGSPTEAHLARTRTQSENVSEVGI